MNKEKPSEQSGKPINKEQIRESLFSEREKTNIVKGFITSYIEGKVSVEFGFLSESSKEIHSKFIDAINVCYNEESTTPAQLKEAISTLFAIIIVGRSTEVLKGEFKKSSIEERLQKVEEGLEITNDLVKQFIDWFRDGLAR